MWNLFRSWCGCRCGSVVGTNWTCVRCREIMSKNVGDLVTSGLPLQVKAGMLLLGVGAVVMDAYINPVPYQEILNLRTQNYQSISDSYNTECPICLDQFNPADQVSHTPCKHTFHHECVRGKQLKLCPTCRTPLHPPLG